VATKPTAAPKSPGINDGDYPQEHAGGDGEVDNSGASSSSNEEEDNSSSSNNNNKQRKRTNTGDSHWENVYPKLLISAIDNGLSFPFKHPDDWRAYPFGWTFLAAAQVKQTEDYVFNSFFQVPFSEGTCKRLLPKLVDPEFTESLVRKLRVVMEMDEEFNESVFQGQMAVVRGQIYNLTEALMRRKTPFELVQMPAITIYHEKSRSGFSRRFIAFRRNAPCFKAW